MKKYVTEIIAILFVLIGGSLALWIVNPIKQSQKEIPEETIQTPPSQTFPEALPPFGGSPAPQPIQISPQPLPPETQPSPLPPAFVPYIVQTDPDQQILIGFLGDGATQEGFNDKTLTKMYEIFKKQSVDAIFYAGNLVSGLEMPVPKTTDTKPAKPFPSSQALKEQLEQFSKMYKEFFNGKVPLFPMMGGHETAVPNGEIIFREQFNLDNSVFFEDNTFAYSVAIGDAFFAVIPSDHYDAKTHTVEASFSPEMLRWLQKILPEASKKYRYLFVVGHEPAYPLTSTFMHGSSDERDAFWQTLADNHVLAYFSAHEHLFDRTNRHGVWQVISGGGGTPIREGGGTNPFVHFMVLAIPSDKEKPPTLYVINIDGYIEDQFDLTPAPTIIYKRHISSI